MRVGFLGDTHLGLTLAAASQIRGHTPIFGGLGKLAECDLVMVTQDVENHSHLGDVDERMRQAMFLPTLMPIVLCSQVPPGYTRRWQRLNNRDHLYYQVDTIIMNQALQRATTPSRIIVGAKDFPIDTKYANYLHSFKCSLFFMTYEEAELTKLAVNYYLAKQVEATQDLARVADLIGAKWENLIPGLETDGRLGAYLKRGTVGGHLPRDVKTIEKLLEEAGCSMRSSSVAMAK
jgi:UDP-glucose 6-dehydrogenase